MTDPITREQVERAIDQAVTDHFVIMPMHFGGDAWRDAVPDHVRSGYDVSFDALVRALTRWRDELAAAEPVRPAPAEDSPERLRERREALGLSWRDMANLVLHRSICMDNVPEYANCWHPEDVRRCEDVPDAPAIYAQHRARYAAALSAEESRRAKLLTMDQMADALVGSLVAAGECEPEVVDVPQPTVKRCACPDIHDDVEAEWRPGEPYLTVTHTTVPLALLRAMLEAIDAQRPVAHAAASERVVERLRAMTPAEGLAALVDAGIVTPDGELTEAYREREPARPEPRYKVGDWVSGPTAPVHSEKMLLPALDPALHETARKTVAWLRGGARGTGPADFTTLPGWSDWNSGSRWDAAEHWAAHLERLLGGAS